MKSKFAIFFFLISLSGCVSTVTWDGFLPGKTYKIIFKDETSRPVSGISTVCSGNEVWPSNEIAKEINDLAPISNELGVLEITHSGYETGGTYKEFGPYTWGDSGPTKVQCRFMYEDAVIESGDLTTYNELIEIVVSQKI